MTVTSSIQLHVPLHVPQIHLPLGTSIANIGSGGGGGIEATLADLVLSASKAICLEVKVHKQSMTTK